MVNQPFTRVTLIDEDGGKFRILLPGVCPENRGADIEAAIQILDETPELRPRGTVEFGRIEYVNVASS